MRKLFALFLIVLLPQMLVAQMKPLVLTHATVIDMTGAPPKSDMTVIISGNLITALGKSNKVRVPKDAQTIAATGKFLIPGLWDMHTHLSFYADTKKPPFTAFPTLIANGVTGVRDVGTSLDLREAAKLRKEINAGQRLAPRLFYAGRVLIGEMPRRKSNRWTGISTVVKTAEEARKAVETLARARVDFIKAEKRTPPNILKEIIRTAHQFNLRVVAVPLLLLLTLQMTGWIASSMPPSFSAQLPTSATSIMRFTATVKLIR